MSTSRPSTKLVDLKGLIIDACRHYFYANRGAPYVNKNREYDEKKDPFVKPKINYLMRVLYAVSFHLNDNNEGNKVALLAFVDELIAQNAALINKGYRIRQILNEIKTLLTKHMVDEGDIPFITPPVDLSNLNLVRPVVNLCKQYDWTTPSRFYSKEIGDHRKMIIFTGIKILFSKVSSNSVLVNFDNFRTNYINSEKSFRDTPNKYFMSAFKFILPIIHIKDIFMSLNINEQHSLALSNIVAEYCFDFLNYEMVDNTKKNEVKYAPALVEKNSTLPFFSEKKYSTSFSLVSFAKLPKNLCDDEKENQIITTANPLPSSKLKTLWNNFNEICEQQKIETVALNNLNKFYEEASKDTENLIALKHFKDNLIKAKRISTLVIKNPQISNAIQTLINAIDTMSQGKENVIHQQCRR